jgi:DinB family protein
MSELQSYSHRLRAAREAIAATPLLGPGEPGAPDESTGERWDRSNVLGHLAEMLPYWTSQMRAVIGGSGEVGRGEAGYARRRQGIDSGHVQTEEALRSEIDAGIEGLAGLLAEMREGDLDRPVLYKTRDGERTIELREVVETVLVGHLEEHLRQLQELTAP